MKKFKLATETKKVNGVILYRIHHLINFINGKIVWNSHGYWIVLG